MPAFTSCSLSGKAVCSLMRQHRITIRAVAKESQITQKRVREVRDRGVKGFLAVEWVFLITGAWVDHVNA